MRIELIHPLLVHFPIALLTIGVLLRGLAIFYRSQLLKTSWIILGIGVFFAWMAVLAGEFAADIVGPTLCDQFVLHTHKTFAYNTAWFFSGALALDWGRILRPRLGQYKTLSLLCFLLYLGGLCTLLYAGALGAGMVYDQGAGVESKCQK